LLIILKDILGLERFLLDIPFYINMALARSSRVIKLAGNPTSQQQQPKLEINDIIADADRKVYAYTRTEETDWIEGETFGFEWARDAAEYLAASRLCNEFHDISNKADIYFKQGMQSLTILKQNGYGVKDSDNPGFYSSAAAFGSSSTSAIIQDIYGGSIPRYRSRNAFGGEYD
jgi:hypothetical protein